MLKLKYFIINEKVKLLVVKYSHGSLQSSALNAQNLFLDLSF